MDPARHARALEPVVATPIGHVESDLVERTDAPRQPDDGAPPAWLVLDATLRPAVDGLAPGDEVVVVTWLHMAARDILVVHPRGDEDTPLTGVFATRSPDRPNPIGLHRVTVTEITTDGGTPRIRVDHLEAVHGTPILDLKPARGC